MSSTTNNSNNRNNITNEQLLILRHYMDQYNRTSNQINRLMTELEHIRHNLDYFSNEIFLNRNQNTNNNGGATRNNTNNSINNTNRRLNSLLSSFLNTSNTNNTNTNFSPITYNFDEPIGLNNFLNTFLSTTVPVVPTQDQINNATRNIRYENIQNPLNESCPISLERFNPNDVVTQICWCGHIFNTNELTSWFRSNVRCPVCRYDIRDYVRPDSDSDSDSDEPVPVISETQTQRQTQTQNLEIPQNISNLTNTLRQIIMREMNDNPDFTNVSFDIMF